MTLNGQLFTQNAPALAHTVSFLLNIASWDWYVQDWLADVGGARSCGFDRAAGGLLMLLGE